MRKAYLAVLSAMATLFALVGGKYVVVTPNVIGYTAPETTSGRQVAAAGQPGTGKSTNPTTGGSQNPGTGASATGEPAATGTDQGADQQGDSPGTDNGNPSGDDQQPSGTNNGGNGGGNNNGANNGNNGNNGGDTNAGDTNGNGNGNGDNNGANNGNNGNNGNGNGQQSTDCKSYDGDSIWIGEIAHYGTAYVTVKVCGGAVTEAKGGVMMSNYEPTNTQACAALDQLAVQYAKTDVSKISYSGATLTSSAYQRSLQSALAQAGI